MNAHNPFKPSKAEKKQADWLVQLFFLLLIAMVGAFAGWAYYGKLDVVSTAVGEVIPSTQVKKVQHLEGGIVLEIMVKEGEAVKKGQPLVSLEPTQSGADVDELSARISSLEADIARLTAEANGQDKLQFPPGFEAQYPQLVAQTKALFNTRKRRIGNQIDGQKAKIVERAEEISEISVRIKNNKQGLKLLNEQIEISKLLMKDQLTNRMQHLNLLKEASDLDGRIQADQASLKRVRAALAGAKNKLAAIRQSFFEKVQKELEKKRREKNEYSSRVKKFEDSLRRTVLLSPVAGVVKTLYVATRGGVVPPGGTVADIVPAGDRLVIEAKLPPNEIGYVHGGQEALITLASGDAQRFGNIKGKVVQVSPDTLETKDGQPYYKVRLETEKTFFEQKGNLYKLVPGVQVLASIRTGQRTILDYLISPFMQTSTTALRER